MNTRNISFVYGFLSFIISFQAYAATEIRCERFLYVHPQGKPTNSGLSPESPLDLSKALDTTSPARPGDCIFLRGGTYSPTNPKGYGYKSLLKGTPDRPIIVLSYPGEWAVIDAKLDTDNAWGGVVLWLDGAYTTFSNFEVINSTSKRAVARTGGGPAGIGVYGDGIQCVNLVVHEHLGGGFGVWKTSHNSKLTGNLIFNNGWQADPQDRGHGHGIYAQNEGGTKTFSDNIIFNQFGHNFHLYGTRADVKLQDFVLTGNVLFNSGALEISNTNHLSSALLVSGTDVVPTERLTVKNNFFYQIPIRNHNGGRTRFFGVALETYGDHYNSPTNTDFDIQDNYIAGEVILYDWKRAVFPALRFLNNTLVDQDRFIWFRLPSGGSVGDFQWGANRYYDVGQPGGNGRFRINKTFQRDDADIYFPEWKELTGFDKQPSSSLTMGKPSDIVFVRQSEFPTAVNDGTVKFVQGRANIIAYNWTNNALIQIPLSQTGLQSGQKFEVRDAQNFMKGPLITGTYNGGGISIPIANLTAASPLSQSNPVQHTAPEFAVFVVIPLSAASSAPPATPTPIKTSTPVPQPTKTVTAKPSPTLTPIPRPSPTVVRPRPTPSPKPRRTATPNPGPGPRTAAVLLIGDGSFIRLPAITTLKKNLSVEFWMRAPCTDCLLLSERKGGLRIHTSNGKIRLDDSFVRTKENASLSDLSTQTLVNDNQWHHVAMTFSPKRASLYIDGVLEQLIRIYRWPKTGFHMIGSESLEHEFVGALCEYHVFAKTLSAAAILQHAKKPICSAIKPSRSVAGAWHFTEGIGTKVPDYSKSFGAAKLFNGASWTSQ